MCGDCFRSVACHTGRTYRKVLTSPSVALFSPKLQGNGGESGLSAAENTYIHAYVPFAGQTCVDIKDNVVDEGFYFTPKGDDPCLSCTCHRGEPEMCVAALCERPQGCQQYRKDPKECCKFMCLDPGETDHPMAKSSDCILKSSCTRHNVDDNMCLYNWLKASIGICKSPLISLSPTHIAYFSL